MALCCLTEILDGLEIDYDSLVLDKFGVRLVKEVDGREIPIIWTDDYEKFEKIINMIKEGVSV